MTRMERWLLISYCGLIVCAPILYALCSHHAEIYPPLPEDAFFMPLFAVLLVVGALVVKTLCRYWGFDERFDKGVDALGTIIRSFGYAGIVLVVVLIFVFDVNPFLILVVAGGVYTLFFLAKIVSNGGGDWLWKGVLAVAYGVAALLPAFLLTYLLLPSLVVLNCSYGGTEATSYALVAREGDKVTLLSPYWEDGVSYTLRERDQKAKREKGSFATLTIRKGLLFGVYWVEKIQFQEFP